MKIGLIVLEKQGKKKGKQIKTNNFHLLVQKQKYYKQNIQ
jgi:hypothetical protein